jgi:formamidase
MTGPVHIEGARRGDVLVVELVDIAPDEYGYTVIVPGFGFLRDIYTEPYIVNWKLTRLAATSDQMPGVRVPMAAFMGSVGVLPGEPEARAWLARETRLGEVGGVALPPQPVGALPADVIPPRENGGNMDVQQMQVGTRLMLPCFIDGCGLFVGDVHYAQGDGEVSGTAIEMGAVVTVRTSILKGKGRDITSPHYEGGAQLKTIAPSNFYATVGMPLKASGVIPPTHTYIDGEGSVAGGAGRVDRHDRLHPARTRPQPGAGLYPVQRGGRPRDRTGGRRAELHGVGGSRSRRVRGRRRVEHRVRRYAA